jgi:phosphoribosylformylglycinamidine synthase
LGQSLWLHEIHGRKYGSPPIVDLYEELENGALVRSLIRDGLATSVHDVSDGGLLVAIAEMALASGFGADLVPYPFEIGQKAKLGRWFAEDQGCFIVTSADANAVIQAAHFSRIPCIVIGYVGGHSLHFHSMKAVELADLRAAHEGFFLRLMGAEGVLA